MVEKRSLKFTGLKNERIKLLIAITILLSSLMEVASLGDTPPIADCGPDKLNCQNVNTPVQFNASASYDPNDSILSYEWDFGDGTMGTGVAPNHTYTSYRWNGTAYLPFIVHLNVTNDLGESNITSRKVTIWIAGDANGDGLVNILDASVVGLKWNINDACADLNNDGSVNILDASIIGLNWNRKASDNTPPAGVTHLINASFEQNYINWTWIDPADTDFASVSIRIDGEFMSNVPKGKQFYEAIGFTANSEHKISTRTMDISGNLNQTWVNHTAKTATTISELPPDPVTVAPPVDTTVATSIGTSTAFLYTGINPIQTGVAPGTIEARRAAVLRGHVMTREGTNLSGVNIAILTHPEFGNTITRTDGMFDMAVNGGGLLTINYEKSGYLTAQRQVNVPWQDYAWLPDVVMIQVDTVVTTIDLSSIVPIQVAQGSVVNDSDGTRQATLLFPQGIQANITRPDGTTQTLTTLNVRATEYTVGENGPEAMPAQLPPTSGYTYAVDLTVDEAMAVGATDVRFDRPVYFYMENFLNFPVGGIVPVGYYNRSLGLWIPSENGRIIQILSITDGMADIDVDGSGTAANAAALSDISITDAERQQLAALYQPGQTLWRVPIMHFTPWDCNWPVGPPQGSTSPGQKAPDQNDPTPICPTTVGGSIIGCQDQVLGEAVDITGTPFKLHYQSDRVLGRKEAYTLEIPLSGDIVPDSLKGINLEVFVAGRSFSYSFPAAPNQIKNFIWDGKDAYGRTLQGKQAITTRIGYVYDGVYQTPALFTMSFGALSGIPISGDRARNEITIWQEWKGSIGSWNNINQGLGSWSLNVHHSYDPEDRVIYLGDGGKRSGRGFYSGVISTVAGGPIIDDGEPAVQTQFREPRGVAAGNDGNIYIADYGNNSVLRLGPDGIITTVAGTGVSGFSGDGGQAVQAQLYYPRRVTAVANGSIYIADSGNNRVRRVGPDGIITTVAGNGVGGVWLSYPSGIGVGANGSIYIADTFNNLIRRVRPDGIITTVAGTGVQGFAGDGGQATQAQLYNPNEVAIGEDGSIYIADSGNNRIRRVGSDGIITTVAGTGVRGSFGGDGGQATQAHISYPVGVAAGADGSIFIADSENNRVRRVGTDGIITTVAGTGVWGFAGDGGQAVQAKIKFPWGVAVGENGSIYIADAENGRVRRVEPNGIITTVAGGTGQAEQDQLSNLSNPVGVATGADGSIFISDTWNNRIRRVGPDGVLTTVAGIGTGGFSGDGGQATQAQFSNTWGIAIGADGSIYIADLWNYRVRRVGPDGIITTVAGTGLEGFEGDGGQAVQAQLGYPVGVAAAADGSIYIADTYNYRIRRVGPDGIITTVAGNGVRGYAGDGGPAVQSQLSDPWGVAAGADGSIYIADTYGNRIRRVGPDGIITTVAGSGTGGFAGDGGQAIQAQLYLPWGLATGVDGSIYIADLQNDRVRRVGPDGIITTVAGSGTGGFVGDGGQAIQAQLSGPSGLAVGADGSIYIADAYNNRIRRITSVMPGLSISDLIIPSEDGSEIFLFSSNGRHLRTLDALTGAVQYNFTYDSTGRLTAIIDCDNNTVTIERDAKGNATAIVSPYGQRTNLMIDTDGYLASITGPAGETTQFSYTSDGLLTNMTDPRNNIYRFSYDGLGRLIKDEDPAGGSKTLSRSYIATDTFIAGYSVKLSTGLNRKTTYSVSQLSIGDQRLRNTFPDGLTTETLIGANGTQTVTYPDGTRTIQMQGPDPRFGMQAPVTTSMTITTPAGLTQTITGERTASLLNPDNLLSLQTLTDTTSINGRTFTGTFNATARNITSQTPMGRNAITTLDNKGRVMENKVPGIIPVQYSYDRRGRLGSITQGTRNYGFNYDADGNLASTTDPMLRTAYFEYDAAGRVTRQTLTDGRQIQYTYDATGNVRSIKPPGRPNHNFTYTPVDLIEKYLPPDVGVPNQTRYTYNIDRDLIRVTRPDGATIDLGYDSAGRLNTTTYPQGSTSLAYNPTTGKLKTITAPDGGTITYTYDGSLLTDTAWSGTISGSVHRTYDNNFRITSESVNGGNAVSFQYDLDGLLTKAGSINLSRNSQNGMLTGTSLGSVTDTLSYSSFGETAAYQAFSSATNIFSVNYTRDDLGRISRKNETIDGAAHSYNYTYDLAGRLTDVRKDGILLSRYSYDANGNRLNYIGSGGAVTGTYDDQDRLMQYDTWTYTYTANGELLSKTNGSQTTTYHYDVLGNLLNVTLPDGTKIEYIVDGQNRRIGKKVNGVLMQGFLYENQLSPIAELDGDGNVVSKFVYASGGNVPDYMVKGGNTYRIITDHLGSPRLVIDAATGAVAQRMDYDEFGNVILDSNSGFQPFGFAGGLYDRDTRLVRFGARDYDAETGRWTLKDSIGFDGGDTNLYGYVQNDPVNFIDSNGNFLWVVAGGIIGAGVNVAMTAWANGGVDQLSSQQIWASALSGAISGSVGALAGPLGGSAAKLLGYASNGFFASVAAGGISALGGAAGQASANWVDPCHTSSVANAAVWGGIGGGLTKNFFPTQNLNTLAQAARFGASTFPGLFGSNNAWWNLGSFATSAGVGGAANF